MLKYALISCLFFFAHPAYAETILLMAEQDGCYYCEKWDDEISKIYPKTSEGKSAPLRRYDIHAGTPEGHKLEKSVQYTPTFILIQNGVESGRIEGYPGEDFFWTLLKMLLDDAKINMAG